MIKLLSLLNDFYVFPDFAPKNLFMGKAKLNIMRKSSDGCRTYAQMIFTFNAAHD